MASLNEGLSARVRELIRPSRERQPLMETTGTRAAIAALDARLQVVEEAVRDLAVEVDELAHSRHHDARV